MGADSAELYDFSMVWEGVARIVALPNIPVCSQGLQVDAERKGRASLGRPDAIHTSVELVRKENRWACEWAVKVYCTEYSRCHPVVAVVYVNSLRGFLM